MGRWFLAIAMAGAVAAFPVMAQGPTGSYERTAPTPFVTGGVRLNLDRLHLAKGPVRQGEDVLSGTADHAETGRLATPMTLRAPFINQLIEPGVVLHRVEFARQSPEGSRAASVWCGDFEMKTIIGARGPVLCLDPEDPLKRAYQMGSAPAWLSTASVAFGSAPIRLDHFTVDRSATDLLGEMDVQLQVRRIRRNRITLRLIATMHDRSINVLDVDRPVINGVADFPFWTHRLRLTVVGDAVEAELSASGDGFGLGEIGVYLNQ